MDQFKDWLHQEITNCLSDRQPLEQKWKDQIVQWKASRPKHGRDFPWPDAPAFEFPLTAIHSDPVISDFYQTLHTPQDYLSVTAKRPERSAAATATRRFLTALDKDFLRISMVNERALMDQVVLGTSVYKNHWRHERKPKPVALTGDGPRQVEIKSGPRWEHVPLQHFLIPASAWDIDPDAPVGPAQWVAERLFMTKGRLKQRAKSDGRYLPDYDPSATEKVLRFLQTPNSPVDETIRLIDSYEPYDNQRIELYEVHVRFDTQGDGVEDELIVIWHHQSMTPLRISYSPFAHGKRPYHRVQYLPSFGFYGIGIAEKDEWSQSALSMLFEANIHNVLLANTRAYAAPFGSTLRPGEPMYPGRVVNLQPGESVGEIRLSDIYQSLPQLQQFILGIAQQQIGVSELMNGDVTQLPSRTPATTAMSALREGKKRFDMIMSKMRVVHSEMGLRLLQNVAQQYREDPDLWNQYCFAALGDDDAMLVLEVLNSPPDELESAFGIDVTATSAMVNKDAENQALIGMMQVLVPMYQQAVQTAMLLMQMPPGTPPHAAAAASFNAIVELIGQIIARHDIPNPREYTGELQKIADMVNPSSPTPQPLPVPPMSTFMPPEIPAMSPYGAGLAIPPQLTPLL